MRRGSRWLVRLCWCVAVFGAAAAAAAVVVGCAVFISSYSVRVGLCRRRGIILRLVVERCKAGWRGGCCCARWCAGWWSLVVAVVVREGRVAG